MARRKFKGVKGKLGGAGGTKGSLLEIKTYKGLSYPTLGIEDDGPGVTKYGYDGGYSGFAPGGGGGGVDPLAGSPLEALDDSSKYRRPTRRTKGLGVKKSAKKSRSKFEESY